MMSLLSRKPTPMVVDCRRSPIEEQTLAARVTVPISDATVEIRIGTNGACAFGLRRQQLREAAAKSNEVLQRLASRETVPRRERPGSARCECAMLWVQVWTVLAHGAWQ
jgi:hypothetical protein